MFSEISEDGYISLEAWIAWATKHIALKESKLQKVWPWSSLVEKRAGMDQAGNTKGGSITVLLTSCLTGLESAV